MHWLKYYKNNRECIVNPIIRTKGVWVLRTCIPCLDGEGNNVEICSF